MLVTAIACVLLRPFSTPMLSAALHLRVLRGSDTSAPTFATSGAASSSPMAARLVRGSTGACRTGQFDVRTASCTELARAAVSRDGRGLAPCHATLPLSVRGFFAARFHILATSPFGSTARPGFVHSPLSWSRVRPELQAVREARYRRPSTAQATDLHAVGATAPAAAGAYGALRPTHMGPDCCQ